MVPADADSRPKGAPGGRPDGLASAAADPESTLWLTSLRGTGRARDEGVGELHELLLRAARAELRRRGGRSVVGASEVEDLAHQVADDAVVAVLGKLDQFRGESRFTTWAYKFAVLEVSAALGRQFRRRPTASLDVEDWEGLPDRFGIGPEQHAERLDLIAAVRHAVDTELSARQRHVFVALVVNGVPLDALVIELGSNRNAIYKTMFDARSKLRAALAANGYVDPLPKAGAGGSRGGRPSRNREENDVVVTGWEQLDRFLSTDPADVGCAQALEVLHVYVELVLDGERGGVDSATRRFPGVAAHLAACGPCGEDFDGLLATITPDSDRSRGDHRGKGESP